MTDTTFTFIKTTVDLFKSKPDEKKDDILKRIKCFPGEMVTDRLLLKNVVDGYYAGKVTKEDAEGLMEQTIEKYRTPAQDTDKTDVKEEKVRVVKEVVEDLKKPITVPTVYKKGDVLMHPNFLHPYVLLYKKKGVWVCSLMTSEPTCDEILCKAESRFFPTSYITKVLFTVATPRGKYVQPYENNKHLNMVTQELKKIFL
jgi:hypothetical protein